MLRTQPPYDPPQAPPLATTPPMAIHHHYSSSNSWCPAMAVRCREAGGYRSGGDRWVPLYGSTRRSVEGRLGGVVHSHPPPTSVYSRRRQRRPPIGWLAPAMRRRRHGLWTSFATDRSGEQTDATQPLLMCHFLVFFIYAFLSFPWFGCRAFLGSGKQWPPARPLVRPQKCFRP